MAKNAAVQKLKAAKAALRNNAAAERKAGVTVETDTYVELNSKVVEAEKDVPWWRR